MASRFHDIANDLRTRIAAEEWKPGERLPTFVQLAEHYGTTQNTIGRAVDVLRADGLVDAVQGRGITLMPTANPQDAATVSYLIEAGHLKNSPRSGWLLAGIQQPESVAEHSYRVGIIAFVIATLEGGNADRAATLALFHDVPETRTGDVPTAGKKHVTLQDANDVAAVQTAHLSTELAAAIRTVISEFEAKETLEARCAKDADKIECLLQAREYQARGNTLVQPWIDTMLAAVKTTTGRRLAEAAVQVPVDAWWHDIVAASKEQQR